MKWKSSHNLKMHIKYVIESSLEQIWICMQKIKQEIKIGSYVVVK